MDFRVLVIVLILPLCSSEPDEFRLVGEDSRCKGLLEMNRQGYNWRPVSSLDNHLNLANRLCTELHCGSALSVTQTLGSRSSKISWIITSECEQSSFSNCFKPLPIQDSLELKCSDSVRLVHGSRLCSGSLQIHWDRSWTSVCEEDFDLQDAEVVCRELGCGAPSLLQWVLYGEGQTFHCEGHESALMDCPRSGSPENTCSSGRAVNLTCSDVVAVRLVGQPSRCAGTVELRQQKKWRRLYFRDNSNQTVTAIVVCRELNCGSAVSGEQRKNFPKSSAWRVSDLCVKKTYALKECVAQISNHVSTWGVDVVCSDLLTRPNIFLTGVSEAQPQGLRVLLGSHFTVTCSINPQYPGGSFQLTSPTVDSAQNHTLPAVNHSAHFLFSDAGPAHQGNYTCVYHLHVFNHNFSSQSHTLYLTLGASDSDLIIRVLVILLLKIIYIPALYFYCKSIRRQHPTQQ